ncbi:diacylglycerol kinase beta-like isoform X1 [Argonauta hians]
MAMQWQKLSPAQFQQLQEYCNFSPKKVKDVMEEFNPKGVLSNYNPDQPIDYAGFLIFMQTYLDMKEVPDELCKALFQSFMKSGADVQGVQGSILIKDAVCYLSLVEGGTPEEKLEFMFRLYDSDNNGYLDSNEIDCIINQMMSVAEYLGWDVSELKPILQDMMKAIDYDSDGRVTLEEWKKGGLTTIPLLVLLGLDVNVKDDGTHCWYLKHFRSQMSCNMCKSVLSGMGKKGLCCQFCKYVVHERCVQKAPASCIMTYVKTKNNTQDMHHHWIDGNCTQKCDKCKKSIKSGINGKTCRWCKASYHEKCASSVKQECDLGEFREHILPPTSIVPAVVELARRRSVAGEESVNFKSPGNNQSSFQINPLPNTHPLLVFINPKSGGKQGDKMFRKFQYMLNPRQVYNLTKGGPKPGLQFFKDVKCAKVLVCGGDGTVGWILDAMDKMNIEPRLPVAVLPLGTGNDLARCLNWGPGYEGESLEKIIHSLEKTSVMMLDRWHIEVKDVEESGEPGDSVPLNIINNYFSIGVDASICHRFHTMREKHPEKFNSRIKNKMWYFEFGTSETFSATCKNLHENIEVSCEGCSLDVHKGPGLEGIAMLNIPTIYGGASLWGENPTKKQKQKLLKSVKKKKDQNPFPQSKTELQASISDIGDKLFEVAGVENSLHAGMVSGKVRSGNRLAQTAQLQIKTKKRVPMQIDGEPWVQNPCTIIISHKNQAPMLMGPKEKTSGGFLKIFR